VASGEGVLSAVRLHGTTSLPSVGTVLESTVCTQSMTRRKKAVSRDASKRHGRELADSLRAQGMSPEEVFGEITRRNLDYMASEAAKKGRCLQCWQTARHGCCICDDMQQLQLRVPMRILIWCHARDFLNAGDDAKLLPCCVAGRASTEMMLFGTPDDERLGAAVMARPERSLLLFPDETAITIQEYLDGGDGCSTAAPDGLAAGSPGASMVKEELTVVVLNGTWGNVKPMLRHFNTKIDPGHRVRHVALQPDTLSVYARAQRRMNRQVSLERICSVEAVALLLKECGEMRLAALGAYSICHQHMYSLVFTTVHGYLHSLAAACDRRG
jgi:DTW domain-containing protein YfiP